MTLDWTQILHIAWRAGVFILGAFVVAHVFISALKTFVLPRSARTFITRMVFEAMYQIFTLRMRFLRTPSYEARDHVMAMYAPLSLLVLPLVWLTGIGLGFTLMFWAFMPDSLYNAFSLSGSSLLTLGFTKSDTTPTLVLEFFEAAFGLTMVALLIAYLPTMYSAFQRREIRVTMLTVRAGSPPSPVEFLTRASRIKGLDALTEFWEQWEIWFVDLEESHTSLAMLTFFRSPQPRMSWITAAGVVLDTASLYASTLDVPNNPQAQLCIRAGYIALRRIADFFEIDYDPDPRPYDPISIAQAEFYQVYDQLAANGVPLKADREQAWVDFRGWRVNYDRVLLGLARMTYAPYAQWVSDRSLPRGSIYRRRNGSRETSVQEKVK